MGERQRDRKGEREREKTLESCNQNLAAAVGTRPDMTPLLKLKRPADIE